MLFSLNSNNALLQFLLEVDFQPLHVHSFSLESVSLFLLICGPEVEKLKMRKQIAPLAGAKFCCVKAGTGDSVAPVPLSDNNSFDVASRVFQGTPSVTETFIDSKKEVDNQLKTTCEDFIALVTDMLIGPLKTFLTKVWCSVAKKKKI